MQYTWKILEACGCPVVIAQWQSIGCTSQTSWVRFPATATHLTELLVILLQHQQTVKSWMETPYLLQMVNKDWSDLSNMLFWDIVDSSCISPIRPCLPRSLRICLWGKEMCEVDWDNLKEGKWYLSRTQLWCQSCFFLAYWKDHPLNFWICLGWIQWPGGNGHLLVLLQLESTVDLIYIVNVRAGQSFINAEGTQLMQVCLHWQILETIFYYLWSIVTCQFWFGSKIGKKYIPVLQSDPFTIIICTKYNVYQSW